MSSPPPLAEAPRRRADRARQVADILASTSPQRPVRGRPAVRGGAARQFGATRNAVREALDLLRAEG